MDFSKARDIMVSTQIESRGIRDSRLLEILRKVPRHEFVPESAREFAYRDAPLSIGCGQTISQPYMVALMVESLQLNENSRVLDIGTGSGYQTAILAELAKTVYSIERESQLAAQAQETLNRLGYKNIATQIGDGSVGWPEFAPYDAIIATAAPEQVPGPLQRQLAEGGRLVIPVGSANLQNLRLIERRGKSYRRQNICSCTFVPLVGSEGWGDDPL